jgi:hypothetical protein
MMCYGFAVFMADYEIFMVANIRVGLARQTGPGNLVWPAHFIEQKSPTYHNILVRTTVVMATHGLHWKWQSLTFCQRHPSKPI